MADSGLVEMREGLNRDEPTQRTLLQLMDAIFKSADSRWENAESRQSHPPTVLLYKIH
jgi:hypothetical protein